jgi:AcrR family transcriptional regulator
MAKDSKTRILQTALDEFSAHGYAGARVGRIASSSRTNKQLIYYYFGSKKGLYHLLYWIDFHQQHPYFLRLLEWEGVAYARQRRSPGKPRKMWKASLDRLRKNQGAEGWPKGLPAGQALVACMALVSWPMAFPQLCRQITGLDADDPRFIRDRRKFIGQFVRALARARP